jgi:membrane protein
MSFLKIRDLLLATMSAFFQDKCMRLAAAVSYTAMFSVAPLLIILIAVGGRFLAMHAGTENNVVVEDLLITRVERVAGTGAAEIVQSLIKLANVAPSATFFAQTITWGALIFGAMAFFSAIQGALNSIWYVEFTYGGIQKIIRQRFAAFLMLLTVAALLLASMVVNIAFAFLVRLAIPAPLLDAVTTSSGTGFFIILAVCTVAFAALFKILPDVNIQWRDVWIGAFATAVLFVVGEEAISLYFRYGNIASTSGAASSLLLFLFWIYYSSVLVLLGAEFVKAQAGKVRTTLPTAIRMIDAHPAGIDPRAVQGESDFKPWS